MAHYFKNVDTGLITVVKKELETLTGTYGLEVFIEDGEWESVNNEGFAHFGSEGDFIGIVSLNLGNQVNSNIWSDLDEGSKYRFEYDTETILSRDEVLERLKDQDADKVLIEWDGSNHIVYTFVSAHGYREYDEIKLDINLNEPIFSKAYNVGSDYLYQDSKSKKYYLGHTTKYANDLFEKLEEWEPGSKILEKIEEEFKNLDNGILSNDTRI